MGRFRRQRSLADARSCTGTGADGHPDLWGFGDGQKAFFWLKQGKPDPASIHWGFIAENNKAVDAFYKAAIAAGAKNNISPRARLEYYPGYYAADVFDPDGYTFEVVLDAYFPTRLADGRGPTAMSDTVLILGSGFSFDAGIPLLGGFVDRMLDLQVRRKHGSEPLSDADLATFDAAMAVRSELNGYHGRARFDDRNIEDILSILSFNWLGGSIEDRDKLSAFNRAIARTIELSCKVTHEGVRRDSRATAITSGADVYRRFWKALMKWHAAKHEIPTILTFNYDLVLERSLLQTLIGTHYSRSVHLPTRRIGIRYYHDLVPDHNFKVDYCDYGMDKWTPGTRLSFSDGGGDVEVTTIELLKLHGSLNFPRARPADDDTSYNIAESLDDPIILPPIFNKMTAEMPTRAWRAALQRLRKLRILWSLVIAFRVQICTCNIFSGQRSARTSI